MNVILNSLRGRLEGEVFYGSVDHAVLLLHPHPSFGGHMKNPVMENLYKNLAGLGLTTLRFNFRSVHEKLSQQHKYKHVEELSDAAIALDWLEERHVANHYWVVGVSFGSWIGMQLIMRRPEIQNFIFVGLPVNLFDFDFIQPARAEGLIIQSENDKVVQLSAVLEFIKKLEKLGLVIHYKSIPKADHLFKKGMPAMIRSVNRHIKTHIKEE